jgi:hypothetical protein
VNDIVLESRIQDAVVVLAKGSAAGSQNQKADEEVS